MPSEYPVFGDRPIDQWKVTELKEELRKRRLPIKGLKEDLVKRLFDAITSEPDLQKEDNPDNDSNPDGDAQDPASEFPNDDSEAQVEEAVEAVDQETEQGETSMMGSDVVPDTGKDISTHVINDDLVGAAHVHSIDEDSVPVSTPMETSSSDPNILNTSSEPSIQAPEVSENNEDKKIPVHDSDVQVNDDQSRNNPALESHDKGTENSSPSVKDITFDEAEEVSEVKPDSNSQNMPTQIDTSMDSTYNVNKGDTDVLSEDVPKSQCDSNNQVFEAKPDLGLQVSYESISTNSISVDEKNELNDNINNDNLNIEFKVLKPEMVLPSSSETSVGGDLHTLEDVIKHEENHFPSIEEPCLEKTTDKEADIKTDNADGGYSEKINLDRSSGDESMEEDVLENKIEDNSTLKEDKASSLLTMDTEDAPQHDDGRVTQSSIPENAALDEEVKPAILSEKRKLPGTEPVAEPVKRQRRWGSDPVKVPERQFSNISVTDIPKDPLLPTPKRVIARSDSTAKGDVEKERTVPQSSRPPTTSLRIDRFLRPFTLKAVQELLSKTGTICSFWMDNIKTHCYVTFSSEEEAVATRNAVYNLQWPPNGGRLLVAEFVDPQDVKLRVEAPPESPAPVTPSPRAPPASVQQPQMAPQPPLRQPGSRQPLPPPPLLSAPPVQSNPPLPRERPVAPVPALKEPDPPILTLDDLFMKTKTTPRIYYLPLSEEQVAAKRANQLKNARS